MVDVISSLILDDEFDFKDIFPLCRNNFKAIEHEDNIKYANVCNNISTAIGDRQLKFVDTCKKISLYLEYIKDKKYANHIKPSCLYFNYMLKDAKNKYSFKCNNTEECYEKMIEQYINDSKSGFDICKAYVKDFINDTFIILNNLNTLYYNFLEKIVFENNNSCNAAKECLKIYSPFSEICQKGNNQSFCKVLQNFQAQYNDQMKKVTICNDAPKYLPSPYGTNMRIIIISLFIITFALSAILFILYKCTPCGSYIRPRKKKLNKVWKYKEEKHLKLRYPLEKSSKTSSGETYQITYNSAQFSL